MITTITKYKCNLRPLTLFGVALATMLTLFIGTAAFPGFSPTSFAHTKVMEKRAVQALSLCAATPNVQNCTDQDPIAQGCLRDAQTVAFKLLLDAQGQLLATLQRRYSPTCHSEWGYMTDDGKQPLSLLVNQHMRSTQGNVVYSAMVFIPDLSVAPQIDGSVSINGIDPTQANGQALTTSIPALPPAQNLQ